MFTCPYCDEYDVDVIPTGMGGMDNLCNNCHEYTITSDNEEVESHKEFEKRNKQFYKNIKKFMETKK